MRPNINAPKESAPPATPRPGKSPPPRVVWPSQAEQLTMVHASGERRCAAAFERYGHAKSDAQHWAGKLASLRHWPSHPDLLHPELQASNRRRLEEDRGKQLLRHALVDKLYQAYLAQEAEAARTEVVLRALMPPPRLVDLVGGPEAFVQLPEMPAAPTADKRAPALAPVAVTPQQLGAAPIARGLDHQNRLFVAIAFQKKPAPDAPPGAALSSGVVTLHQAQQDPLGPWVILNPDRFTPPGGTWRGNLSPVLPNMAGRAAVAGGPDAQVMLAALKALATTGTAGAYRTPTPRIVAEAGAAPGPSHAPAL